MDSNRVWHRNWPGPQVAAWVAALIPGPEKICLRLLVFCVAPTRTLDQIDDTPSPSAFIIHTLPITAEAEFQLGLRSVSLTLKLEA